MNPGDTPIHLHLNLQRDQNKTVHPPSVCMATMFDPGCFVLREKMPISVINIRSDPHIMTNS